MKFIVHLLQQYATIDGVLRIGTAAAYDCARSGASLMAITLYYLTGNHRGRIPPGRWHQALGAAWKVIDQIRPADLQGIVVEHLSEKEIVIAIQSFRERSTVAQQCIGDREIRKVQLSAADPRCIHVILHALMLSLRFFRVSCSSQAD
jgi:hypothetical protein